MCAYLLAPSVWWWCWSCCASGISSRTEGKVDTSLRRKLFQRRAVSDNGSVMKSKQTALGFGGQVTACNTLINCLHFVLLLFKFWLTSTRGRREEIIIINYAGCACQVHGYFVAVVIASLITPKEKCHAAADWWLHQATAVASFSNYTADLIEMF